MTNGDGFLSRKILDLLFMFQLTLFATMCTLVVVITLQTSGKVADLNKAQVEFAIQQNKTAIAQNNRALCNQHDMIVAVKLIGDRLNILRTEDIPVPDISGLECLSDSFG